MSESRRFVRVYYDDMIRDYPEVWNDDRQLSTWLRLLAASDPVWPTKPELPRAVKATVLQRLKDSSLISALPSHRYEVKGFEAERQRRADAARTAAAVRWQSKSNAPAMPTTNPEPIQTNTESMTGFDGRIDVETFVMLKGRAPTIKQRRYLDRVLEMHDLTGPKWAADIMRAHPEDPIGAVMEADRHWRDERLAAARREESKAKEPTRPKARGLSGINAELANLMREADEKRGAA